MDIKIARINEYLSKAKKTEKQEPIEVLMELALEAGLDSFNPFRATDFELQEIYTVVSQK